MHEGCIGYRTAIYNIYSRFVDILSEIISTRQRMRAGEQHKYFVETFGNFEEGLAHGVMETISLSRMFVAIIILNTRGDL